MSHEFLVLSKYNRASNLLLKLVEFGGFLDLQDVGILNHSIGEILHDDLRVSTSWSYDETNKLLFRFASCFDSGKAKVFLQLFDLQSDWEGDEEQQPKNSETKCRIDAVLKT